ncbi:MAG: phosphate ABC transporter permease subunit PstC, partial [Candidatus Omnitrophica bacterium CG10_big_fil_rev_8_21_14_0_10_43_8]
MENMIKVKERLYKWLFTILAFASLIFLVGIVIVLFKEALPIFKKVKALEFIFGKFWYPTYDPPEFGIFPLILASVWVSVGAMLVCVPLGVGSA